MRVRTSRIAALTATFSTVTLLLAGCALPGSEQAKKAYSAKTKTAASGGDSTDPNAAASTGVYITPVDAKSSLALGAAVLTAARDGAGTWTVKAVGYDSNLTRYGIGRGGSTALSGFLGDSSALRVGYGVVNAVMVGKDSTGTEQTIMFATTKPTLMPQQKAIVFDAAATPDGSLDGSLAKAAGVTVDETTGVAAPPTLPDDGQQVTLTEATLFLDTANGKAIGACLLAPASQCTGAAGSLFRSDINGLNLTGMILTGANLASSTMTGVNFTSANLAGAQLFRSDARNGTWNSANLTKVNAHQITFTGSRMMSLKADGADMFRAEMDNTVLTSASFVAAAIQQATMRQVQGRGVDFTRTNLFRAEMSNSDYSNATFERARMAQVIAMNTNFSGAQAANSDMSAIDARGANFTNADLSKVQLSKSTLKNTNFAGADLRGANLFQADINGANFAGAQIAGMTCPNGDIIGKTVTWKYRGKTKRLTQCRPVYRAVNNTTATDTGTDNS